MAVQRLKDVDKRTVGFPREGGDDEDFSRLAGAGRWGGGVLLQYALLLR